MTLDLPEVSRTGRVSGEMIWLPFIAAARELADEFADLDRREIEQLLFAGSPFLTDRFIYVPQTVILNLVTSAVRRGMIEPPEGLPAELWATA